MASTLISPDLPADNVDGRWADIVDETGGVRGEATDDPSGDVVGGATVDCSWTKDTETEGSECAEGLDGALLAALGDKTGGNQQKVGSGLAGGLVSAGSRHHDIGRCKPCAFLHTKGCNSGASCQFCHRCPAHEKQRRKRLRRQLLNGLSSFDSGSQRFRTAGHSRQPSGASMSSSTWSSCGGAGSAGQFSHSRQASTASTQAPSTPGGPPGQAIGSSASLSSLGFAAGTVAGVAQQLTQSPQPPPRQPHSWETTQECGPTPSGALPIIETSPAGDQGWTPAMQPSSPTMMYNGVQYTLVPVPVTGPMASGAASAGPMAAPSPMPTMSQPLSPISGVVQPPVFYPHHGHAQADMHMQQPHQQHNCYSDAHSGQWHGGSDQWTAHDYNSGNYVMNSVCESSHWMPQGPMMCVAPMSPSNSMGGHAACSTEQAVASTMMMPNYWPQ